MLLNWREFWILPGFSSGLDKKPIIKANLQEPNTDLFSTTKLIDYCDISSVR